MTPPSSPIKLRGHHLICLHFFHGEGYNPEFVSNLRELMKKASEDKEIIVQTGADAVCDMCPYLKNGACAYDKGADNAIREMDKNALELLGTKAGERVQWADIGEKLPGIFNTWFQAYCLQCGWRKACEENKAFPGYLPR